MTSAELLTRLQTDFSAQSGEIVVANYSDSIADAERETGWALPQTANFRVDWLIKRSTRHLLYKLAIQSARKFRAEGYHLDQRFTHYTKLLDGMDKEFQQAIEENPAEFADVDTYKMFGYKIDAGFSTNDYGQDTTYTDNNEVVVTPSG